MRVARSSLIVLFMVAFAASSRAVTKNWNDGTGNWSDGANWTPAGVPAAGDVASIAFADDVARTITYDYTGPAITLSHVDLDLSGPGTNSVMLAMSANALTTNSGEIIGDLGRAMFDHSGGTNTVAASSLVLGNAGTGVGAYNLSGTGTLAATTIEIVGAAGIGNFNQSGGTNTISGAGSSLSLGFGAGTGNYTLSGGALSVADFEYVGRVGTGVFDQSGGSNTAGALTVGDAVSALGTYSLNGGTLTVTGGESIGTFATGNDTQTGGTFAQTGGIHNVGALTVGSKAGATGSYTLNSGTLVSLSSELIGDSGTGNFSQSGGVHTTIGNVSIGADVGATGNYSLSGNATANAANIYVGGRSSGAGGTGTMSLFGSNNILTVPGTIKVYNTPGTSFNLNGGTLNVGAMNVGGVPSLFNWNGGTLHVTNDVAWDSGASADSTSRLFGSSLSLSGSSRTLRVTGNETIGGLGGFSLSLGSSATHSVTGNITVKPGGTLSTSNTSVLSYGSLTQAGGSITGSLRNVANFTHQSGTLSAFFVNAGTVSFGSSLTMSGGLSNETTMTVGTGQTLSVGSNGISNLGTFTLNGGTIAQGPTFLNSPGGTLIAHGTINPSVNNQGTLIVDGVLTIGTSSANSGILQGAGTLSIASFSTLSNSAGGVINSANPNGTLVITSFQNNNVGGIMNVGPTSTLSITSNWTNSGIVNLQGANARLSGGSFTNNGTLEGFGTVTASLATSNSGVFRASGGELVFTGSSIINSTSSQFQVLAGSTARFVQGMLTNSGTISLTGGTFDNNGKILNNIGTINGHGTLRTGGMTNSAGRLISVGGGDMEIFGSVINSGIVSIQSGRTAYFFNSVNGSGTFTGTGTAVFLASLSPGSSPASVSFAGSATLGGGTSLLMELGGTTPGSGYDQIHVAGQLSIGGVLAVSLINGFLPGAGASFNILDWGTLSGTFSSLQLPALPDSYTWDTSQLYTTGILSVTSGGVPGDYNNNGLVDGADYTLWREGGPLANEADTPGVVDDADYTQWRARFGNTSGSGLGGGSVPEPAGATLLLCGMLGAAVFRRR